MCRVFISTPKRSTLQKAERLASLNLSGQDSLCQIDPETAALSSEPLQCPGEGKGSGLQALKWFKDKTNHLGTQTPLAGPPQQSQGV